MEAAKVEMTAVIATAKKLSKHGMYGKAVQALTDFSNSMYDNVYFSLSDEILEALICKDTIDGCGDQCGEMGVGGCCCSVLGLVLAGWGCACLCPECGCCGECSSDFFDTCICDAGKGILGICWETCCCC